MALPSDREPRIRRALPAAVVDAAFNSLTTFSIGLFAARSLQPALLGAYALAFSAYVLSTGVPQQLFFIPAEAVSAGQPASRRLGLLPRSLWLGCPISLLPALCIPLWTLALGSPIPREVALALSVTAVAAAFLSPIQDHVRRMLHQGQRSVQAATMSVIQLSTAGVVIVVAQRMAVPVWWIPFGALAAGNFVSLLSALVLARTELVAERGTVLRRRPIVASGSWLLVSGMSQTAAAFATATVVSRLAGAAALGYAEAARIVGQPPLVALTGLSAVLGPRAVRAAREQSPVAARRVTRLFTGLVLCGGIPYLLLVGFTAPWNPVPRLVPHAYAVSGLVLATVIANLLNAIALPRQFELIGARRTPRLAGAEATANVLRVCTATSARYLGPFAIPLSYSVLGIARALGYARAIASHYGGGPSAADTSEADPRPELGAS